MPSVTKAEKLTQEVKAFALEHGAKMVGIAPAQGVAGPLPGHQPGDWLPGAKSVIICLIPILRSTLKSPSFLPYQHDDKLNHEHLEALGRDLSAYLEEAGYYAISTCGGPLNVEEVHPVQKKATGLPGWIALPQWAQVAGLGEVGTSRILVTEKHGLLGRLVGVITTAELVPDQPFTGKICRGEEACGLCKEHCRSGALRTPENQEWMSLCLREGATVHSLAGVIRHIGRIMREKDEEKRNKLIFGPETWYKYLHLFWGVDTWCNECIKLCPIGENDG